MYDSRGEVNTQMDYRVPGLGFRVCVAWAVTNFAGQNIAPAGFVGVGLLPQVALPAMRCMAGSATWGYSCFAPLGLIRMHD